MMPFLRTAAQSFFHLRAAYPVWYYILNREGRRLWRDWRTPLSGEESARVAQELKHKGIAITHLQRLFPDEQRLDDLFRSAAESHRAAAVKTHKTFLRYLWDIEPELDWANPFVRLALDPVLLSVVNEYLGLAGRFYHLTLNATTPVQSYTAAAQSQRWHRDPEDKKMCKVFLYLNDVDETAGPFTYVRESAYGMRFGRAFPQRPPRGSYPDSAELERIIPPQAIVRCTGPAGTLIFCDTAGLHRGGYATAKERIMFTAGYRSAASVWGGLQYRYRDAFIYERTLNPLQLWALEPNRNRLSDRLFRIIKRKDSF